MAYKLSIFLTNGDVIEKQFFGNQSQIEPVLKSMSIEGLTEVSTDAKQYRHYPAHQIAKIVAQEIE